MRVGCPSFLCFRFPFPTVLPVFRLDCEILRRGITRTMSTDDLCPLFLPSHTRFSLHGSGIENVNDVLAAGPSFAEQTAEVQKRKDCMPTFEFHAASELLHEALEMSCVPTWIPGFDALLNGGIPAGRIFEITGVPGSGKTQFCLQVAASNELLGQSTVYVATKGAFQKERYLDLLSSMRARGTTQSCRAADTGSLQTVLYRFCNTWTELVAVITALPQLITDSTRKITLVIIDGLDFHFRYAVDELALRRRLIAGISQKLVTLADMNVPVLVTNHVSMKAGPTHSSGLRLAPALGEVFGHECSYRTTFFVREDYYEAVFFKAPTFGPTSIKFDITDTGIVDKDLLSDMDTIFSISE